MEYGTCIPVCTVRRISLYRSLLQHDPFHNLDNQHAFSHDSCGCNPWGTDHVRSIVALPRTNLGDVETKPAHFGPHVGSVGWSTRSQLARDQLASTLCYGIGVLYLVYGQDQGTLLPVYYTCNITYDTLLILLAIGSTWYSYGHFAVRSGNKSTMQLV